ncbi:MAG: hypothetical protein JWO57_2808 [Pseudonocardiales bacterium]|nr:hypothetical protein [Pseudonocardiales bacterium]
MTQQLSVVDDDRHGDVDKPHHHHHDREQRERVAVAVRLGWYLAEVRGRNWWRAHRPTTEGLPADPDHPLPLRPQRTFAESRRQAFDALVCLSEQLDVTAPPAIDDPATGAPFAPRLAVLMAGLDADGGARLNPPQPGDGVDPAERERAWREVAELIYDWDAAIQDRLTARDDMLACGYLLGRGMAEIYWALAPSSDQARAGGSADGSAASAGSWAFLLNPARRHELSRMAGRIAPFLSPLTPVAVSGSLEAWGCVAAEPNWCGRDDAPTHLYEQLRRWYQLLVLGQDPATLVRPSTILHGKRTTLRVFRAFWPQLLVGAASVAAVAVFVLLLTSDRGNPAIKTLLALVGTIGLSASTLAAKAKSASQSLLTRLRQSAYSDLVAIEVTTVPRHPDDERHPKRDGTSEAHRMVEQAVTARTIAYATSPASGSP